MECPKCGSTNVTEEERKNGFNFCLNCYFKWKDNYKQPEPTTAEMLYYILQNPPKGQLVAYSFCDKFGDIEYEDSATGESIKNHCFGEDWCKYKTADEAIRAAYKAAREVNNG